MKNELFAVVAAFGASLAAVAGCEARESQPTEPTPAESTSSPDPSAPAQTPAADGKRSSNGVPAADMSTYAVETVATGLRVPWAFAWTSPDRMLVTERGGAIRVVQDGKLLDKPIHEVADVRTGRGGEIGLMGMCVHPEYAGNKYIYIAYASTERDVRVVRLKDTGDALIEPKVIIDGIPARMNHAGCRPAFGPDGKLYITTGESYNKKLAQDMTSLGGKTLRLNDDGSIPDDNPFYGQEGKRAEIFSFGHRNAQGIDWQAGSGLMFQSEHGPSGSDGPQGYDEVNIVEKGHDLGWPDVWGKKEKTGADGPLVMWAKPVAPASGVFYKSDRMPELKGAFLVGCLGGLRRDPEPGVYAVMLDGRTVTGQQRLVTDYGRIREVAVGPDGAIYFSTSNRDGRAQPPFPAAEDDRILRIVPKKN